MNVTRWLLVSALVGASVQTQSPAVNEVPFEGEWISDGPTRGLTAATVFQDAGEWFVKFWGAAQPTDSKIPRAHLKLYKSSFDAASYDAGIARGDGDADQYVLSYSDNHLTVDRYAIYPDNGPGGRPNVRFRQVLIRRPLGTSMSPPRTAMTPLTTVEEAARASYQREFQLRIERPAVWDDPSNGGCTSPRHITSTAYLKATGNRSTLFVLYLPPIAHPTPTGYVPPRVFRHDVLRPAGTIHVLSVVVRYPETVGAHGAEMWSAAQKLVNGDHETFARNHGYKSPLVVFDNTNVVIERSEITDPNEPSAVRDAVRHKGVAPERFDVVMIIDWNPAESRGGFSNLIEHSIYVGNYMHTSTVLTEANWRSIANTAYHHEMAHHWGWEHDWTPTCGARRFEPFITASVLFGWEDIDGDGVPEILSDHPYGRQSPEQR